MHKFTIIKIDSNGMHQLQRAIATTVRIERARALVVSWSTI